MDMVFRGREEAPIRNAMRAGVALAAVLAGCATLAHAQSQAYPAKPIRLIVPFAAGGVTDTPWRIVSAKLAEDFGGQVLIENRPGAGASIGAAIVAAAPADGYTLLGRLQQVALTATFDTGKNFDAKMKVEYATWGKLVKDLNIQAD